MNVKRTAPFTGIAFAILFIASVGVSTAPSNSASDATWVAAYATHGKQAAHLATGILLVLAALSLMSFITDLWMRVVAAGQQRNLSPLPIVAAGISAACIASGGILMGAVSGSALLYSQPLPGADVLRVGNDVGFALVGVAGMLAAAVSVASVSLQARAAGLFGTRLTRASLVVAVLLIGSIAFVPILALLVWSIVVAVHLARSGSAHEPRSAPSTAEAEAPLVSSLPAQP
jgi:hypothetical protein